MSKNSTEAGKLKLFHNSLEAVFLERPNRYIIKAETASGIITAYCPNPGKLMEILIPGRRLILEEFEKQDKYRQDKLKRKTSYTVVAAYYHGRIIPLYSARANYAAEKLIIPVLFPEYKQLKREITIGKSRIDFVLEYNSKTVYLEVKACTLIEHGLAMFPDAPTGRGLKHIKELAELTGTFANRVITEGHILFVIMNPDADEFMPNMHTDFAFSETLLKLSAKLTIHTATVKTDKTGTASVSNLHIPFNKERLSANLSNGGIYVLLIHLKNNKSIKTGRLGLINYKAGYYIYVGSALNSINSRIARHLRKTKKKHWHIDYLTSGADEIKAYPIRTKKPLECDLAGEVSKISDSLIPDFGSSDCNCRSHLFYFSGNPAFKENFLDILFLYRHHKALQ